MTRPRADTEEHEGKSRSRINGEKIKRVLQKSKFFQELDADVQAKIPEIAIQEFKKKDDVIFQQGDVGTHCCILLSGSVNVWISKQEHEDHEAKEKSSDSNSSEDESDADRSSRSGSAAGRKSHEPSTSPPPDSQRGSTVMKRQGSEVGPQQMQGRGSLVMRQRRSSVAFKEDDNQEPKQEEGDTMTLRKRRRSSRVTLPAASGAASNSSRRPSQVERKQSTMAMSRESSASVEPPRVEITQKRKSVKGATLQEAVAILAEMRKRDFGTKVATLPAGSIFGELALLHEQPRNATITCEEDCDLLTIQKEDFDALLKNTLMRAKTDKLELLQAHCPGLKHIHRLPPKKIDTMLYGFEKVTVPKGHCFFKQDEISEAGIFIVWSGMVEFRHRTRSVQSAFSRLPVPEVRQLGVLVRGGAFGPLLPGSPESFSAVATSSSVLLCSCGSRHQALPRSLRDAIRKSLAETMAWRVERCVPSALVGAYKRKELPPMTLPHSRPSTPSGSQGSRTPTNGFGRSRPRTPTSTTSGGAVLDLSFVCPDMGISSASTTASSSGWFASNPMEASDAGDGKDGAEMASRPVTPCTPAARPGTPATPAARPVTPCTPAARPGTPAAPAALSRPKSATMLGQEVFEQTPDAKQIGRTPSRPSSASSQPGRNMQDAKVIARRNPLNFSLDLERCRTLGGQRLRAVRDWPPVSRSSPALVEHRNLIRLRSTLSKSLLLAA
mmetsp:Transcript_15123/g.34415  ORF Transcript_15123/g.34415 Transcript_15123/m.34415 type:complete len:724 (-) Transcript_15123:35-2206(-)